MLNQEVSIDKKSKRTLFRILFGSPWKILAWIHFALIVVPLTLSGLHLLKIRQLENHGIQIIFYKYPDWLPHDMRNPLTFFLAEPLDVHVSPHPSAQDHEKERLIETVSKFDDLNYLVIIAPPTNPESLECLARNRSIRVITLNGKATDTHVIRILDCPKLLSLCIESDKVTPKVLPSIAQCLNLKRVILSTPRIGHSDIRKLKQQRPDLIINRGFNFGRDAPAAGAEIEVAHE